MKVCLLSVCVCGMPHDACVFLTFVVHTPPTRASHVHAEVEGKEAVLRKVPDSLAACGKWLLVLSSVQSATEEIRDRYQLIVDFYHLMEVSIFHIFLSLQTTLFHAPSLSFNFNSLLQVPFVFLLLLFFVHSYLVPSAPFLLPLPAFLPSLPSTLFFLFIQFPMLFTSIYLHARGMHSNSHGCTGAEYQQKPANSRCRRHPRHYRGLQLPRW